MFDNPYSRHKGLACVGETTSMAFGSCGMEISRLPRELSKLDQSFFIRTCMLSRGFDSGREECGWADDASRFSPLTTANKIRALPDKGLSQSGEVDLSLDAAQQAGMLNRR